MRNNSSAFEFNIQAVPILKQVSYPLDLLGIKHFCYAQFFNDGQILRVSNNVEWTEKFFLHKFYNDATIFETQIAQVKEGDFYNFIISGAPQSSHLSMVHDFGFWHIFHMYQRLSDSVELFVFSSTPEQTQIVNLYLNNAYLFKQFIIHFKEKCADILKKDNKNLIKTDLNISKGSILIKKDTNPFNVHKHYLSEEIYLTKKEKNCAELLLIGKSAKEIASILTISPRTVEEHIDDMKKKLDCCSKFHLIQKFIYFGLNETI